LGFQEDVNVTEESNGHKVEVSVEALSDDIEKSCNLDHSLCDDLSFYPADVYLVVVRWDLDGNDLRSRKGHAHNYQHDSV
jgi:hypothetical protein